jgi:hypothetical protein
MGVLGATGVAGARTLDFEGSTGLQAESSVWFDGVNYAPAGDATLSKADGTLVVEGVDEQGDDGATLRAGSAQDAGSGFWLTPKETPAGAYKEVRQRGVVDGTSGRNVGRLRVERLSEGDKYALQPDFSGIGAETYTLQVFDDGSLVAEEAGLEGHTEIAGASNGSNGTTYGSAPISIEFGWDIDGDGDDDIIITIEFNFSITSSGGNEYEGDSVRFIADNPRSTADSIEEVDLLASGISSFEIGDAAIEAFDRAHMQVGNARLRAGSGGSEFYVGNVESDDGVRANLVDASAFKFQLDPIALDTAGDSVTSHAIGTYGGVSGSSLGRATVSSDGSELTVTTDYSALGSENVRLVVYDTGEKVGETVVPDGEVARIPFIPPFGGCGKGVVDFPCYYKRWDDDPFPIVASDGSEYRGNEMELLADDADESVSGLTALEMRGSGIGSATILDETVK